MDDKIKEFLKDLINAYRKGEIDSAYLESILLENYSIAKMHKYMKEIDKEIQEQRNWRAKLWTSL